MESTVGARRTQWVSRLSAVGPNGATRTKLFSTKGKMDILIMIEIIILVNIRFERIKL